MNIYLEVCDLCYAYRWMGGWVSGQRLQYVLHWDINVPTSVIME
jgi:hypothetical protein